jgi:very-short-patch-repair endonuclease
MAGTAAAGQGRDMHATDLAIQEIATRQAGRFTRAQVRSLDPHAAGTIARRLRSGRWHRLTRRVLCLAGAPVEGLGPTLWTSHLHVGLDSVVAGRSALALHGWPGLRPGAPTLAVPAGSHRRAEGIDIRQVTDLAPEHVVRIDGLPVTSVARTLVDLAGEVSAPRLDHLLDHAVLTRLVTVAELGELVGQLRRPGKAGLTPMAAALGRRLPGPGIEQGRLERRLTEVVRRAGIGDGVAQFPHPGRVDSRELADRAWPEAMLLVEADGRTWHDRQTAFTIDRRRDREAAVAGWVTVRFTWQDLWDGIEQSAAQLRAIHEQRCRILGDDQGLPA